MTVLSQEISEAAFRAVRKFVDDSGYGMMVSDVNCRALSDMAATAAITEYAKLHPDSNSNQPLAP